MQKTIKVLLITDEVWNDKIYPNNNMTNWFSDFENIEIAHVYCGEGNPDNKCAFKYFQITDKMMLASLLSNKKAGVGFELKENTGADIDLTVRENNTFFNTLIKKCTKTHFNIFRLLRDFLWLWGRYDISGLTEFINDFNPDIIFTQRVGSVKLCRLERIIKNICNKPMIALTGDNEHSLKFINFSPFFWIRRLMVRSSLKKCMRIYDMYYTSSQEQAEEYTRKYNIPATLMFKCGVPNESIIHNKVNSPIRIVYAGKLYCGRWKTLSALGKAAKKINSNGKKVVVDIYSRDNVTKRQYKKLNDNENIFFRGAVSPEKLPQIYSESDIVLHVESLDIVNRLVTQHSYSTKVIDCLSSGCAVCAIGWAKHSACIELKKTDSAFVATNKAEIFDFLKNITCNPDNIIGHANKAMKEIEQNHSKKKIQQQMYADFLKVMKEERY